MLFFRTQQITSLIDDSNFRTIFLPPYSPFLNPIETIFGIWKGYVKTDQNDTEEALFIPISSNYQRITP